MDTQNQQEFQHQNRDSNLQDFQNFQIDNNVPEHYNDPQNANPVLLVHEEHQIFKENTTDQNGHQITISSKPLYSMLPLKSVKVVFNQVKESMVNSYLLYKVHFVWNDKEFEVVRRFSDFKKLRKAIKNILPFTFVFPIHRKKKIVS